PTRCSTKLGWRIRTCSPVPGRSDSPPHGAWVPPSRRRVSNGRERKAIPHRERETSSVDFVSLLCERGIQLLSLFGVEAPDIPFKEFRIVPIGIFGFYFRAQQSHCLIGRFTLRPQFASTALHETQEASLPRDEIRATDLTVSRNNRARIQCGQLIECLDPV